MVVVLRSLETHQEESFTMLQKMRNHEQGLGWWQKLTCLLPSRACLLPGTRSAQFSDLSPCPYPYALNQPIPRVSEASWPTLTSESRAPRCWRRGSLPGLPAHVPDCKRSWPFHLSVSSSDRCPDVPTSQFLLPPGKKIQQTEHFAPISNHISQTGPPPCYIT